MTTQIYDSLSEIFLKMREILQKICTVQLKVRKAAFERRWTDFTAAQDEVAALGEQLNALETQRKALPGMAEGFYASVHGLEAEKRAPLTALFREVKSLAARVRIENETMKQYVDGQMRLVTLFLEAAFPERRGKFYSRTGQAKECITGGVVLDRVV
jgi:hypothetical protein